jgi:hypothetical protein
MSATESGERFGVLWDETGKENAVFCSAHFLLVGGKHGERKQEE